MTNKEKNKIIKKRAQYIMINKMTNKEKII